MSLLVLLSCGVALGVLTVCCAVAAMRAERRARRNLYASLGLNEELISVLMAQKGTISAQLATVRQASVSGAGGRSPDATLPRPHSLHKSEAN